MPKRNANERSKTKRGIMPLQSDAADPQPCDATSWNSLTSCPVHLLAKDALSDHLQ